MLYGSDKLSKSQIILLLLVAFPQSIILGVSLNNVTLESMGIACLRLLKILTIR